MAKNTAAKTILDNHNRVRATELKNILNFQLDSLFANPANANDISPLLIRGCPGCGKSTIVRELCKQRNIEFIDVRLAQMEPCDIKGLPVPDKENHVMNWFINGSWPRNPNGKGIIFLDEITAADRSIQVAAYELVLDRRLGSLYKVPDGYYIVAAGNNTDDRAVAMTMSSALANRFMHIELSVDAEAWLKWAITSNIHPAVTGFIAYCPHLLFDNSEGQDLERGWPTPRAWERVSNICNNYKNGNDFLFKKMVNGLVGNGAGTEFSAFYDLNGEFDNILNIMRNPDSIIAIPKNIDRKHAMCFAMVYLLWRGKTTEEEKLRLNGFYRICLELSSDFATMALNYALQGKDDEEQEYRCNALLHDPLFPDWQIKHGNAITKYADIQKMFSHL